jgi:DNA polymerase (family 10)
LKTFDFIVASVHSNLKMSEEKATTRLIKAIENPYTSILGHPTGRLLLGRPGYPIDHKKVIDACAANNVHMELNAHPYRLDIDWRWIPYCIEKGVKISINPDAHHREGFQDMYYGLCAARKGWLSADQCLNALPLDELILSFKK